MKRFVSLLFVVCLVACVASTHYLAPQPFAPAPAPSNVLYGLTDGGYTGLLWEVAADYCSWGSPIVVRSPVRTQAEVYTVLASEEACATLQAHLLIENNILEAVDQVAKGIAYDPTKVKVVECGNELELPPLSLDISHAAGFVGECAHRLRMAGYTGMILTAAVYTIDGEQLARVKAYHQACPECGCAIHWYGENLAPWVVQLNATGCPNFAITETGMASRNALEDQGQLAYMQEQLPAFWSLGAWLIEGYQRLSGPTPSNLDNFGWWRFDQTKKPIWELWRRLAQGGR